jgi:hypothetical protein
MRYMSIGLKRQVNVEAELLGRVVKMHKQQTHIFIKGSGVQDIFMALIDEKISIIRKTNHFFRVITLRGQKRKHIYSEHKHRFGHVGLEVKKSSMYA